MSSWLGRALQVDDAEEARLLWRAGSVHFLLLSANYLLRPVRDALAVREGTGDLPWLFTATFVGMLVLQPLYSWAAGKLGRARLVRWVYRICGAVLLGFAAALSTPHGDLAAKGFFVWMSVFNLFSLSLLWSVLADRTNTAAAKRVFGLVALGGTAGALAGPALAASLASVWGPAGLLVLAAGLFEVGIRVGGKLWDGPTHPEEEIVASAWAGVRQALSIALLRNFTVYLLLMTWAATAVYFAQGELVHAHFADDASRTQALALIDLGVSLVTLVLQAVVTGRLLTRLGVGTALALLPLVIVGGLGAVAAFGSFLALAALQVLRRTVNYAFAKPAREAVFTAVPAGARYQAKSLLDTVVYRGGDAVAAWTVAPILTLGLPVLCGAVAALAVPWLWVCVAIGRDPVLRDPPSQV